MDLENGNKRPKHESITDESAFEILVSKADFKFNCAHFIAYKGTHS